MAFPSKLANCYDVLVCHVNNVSHMIFLFNIIPEGEKKKMKSFNEEKLKMDSKSTNKKET